MKIKFKDLEPTRHISQDKLTPGEIDAIERATGLTLAKIRRMGDTCVCEHPASAHQHKDDATGDLSNGTCTRCDCPGHEGDVPSRVSTAFIWISLRRAYPTLKFSDVSDVEGSDLSTVAEDEVAEDPTEAPA
jgi:hypothetical protein